MFGEYKSLKKYYTYEEMQDVVATLNEKESIRKNKGVYYTPIDVVEFILINSVKQVCNILKPNNFIPKSWAIVEIIQATNKFCISVTPANLQRL